MTSHVDDVTFSKVNFSFFSIVKDPSQGPGARAATRLDGEEGEGEDKNVELSS